MRYKALSKRFRQAVGVADPVPAASLVPEENVKEQCRRDENSVRNEIARGAGDGVELQGANVAKEILGACEGTLVSLAAQLELRVNPNYTPPIRTIRTLGDASSSRTLKGSSSLRISSSS